MNIKDTKRKFTHVVNPDPVVLDHVIEQYVAKLEQRGFNVPVEIVTACKLDLSASILSSLTAYVEVLLADRFRRALFYELKDCYPADYLDNILAE